MRKWLLASAAAVAAVGAKVGLDRWRHPSARGKGLAADVSRRRHHLTGRARGMVYHALRRHPDPDVDDATLADRIRSSIGPLEKRLNVPRVHVMVEHGVAILHGEVPSIDAAAQIEHAVDQVAGVRRVQSHLKT